MRAESCVEENKNASLFTAICQYCPGDKQQRKTEYSNAAANEQVKHKSSIEIFVLCIAVFVTEVTAEINDKPRQFQ